MRAADVLRERARPPAVEHQQLAAAEQLRAYVGPFATRSADKSSTRPPTVGPEARARARRGVLHVDFFSGSGRLRHIAVMHTERRELRSVEPARAIRIFLARNATDEGLRAAVVSNDEGELLGGVGDGDLAALAAVGSSLVNVRNADLRDEVCAQRGYRARELHVVRLGVGEQTLVFTSVGAPLGAVGRLAAAVERILAA